MSAGLTSQFFILHRPVGFSDAARRDLDVTVLDETFDLHFQSAVGRVPTEKHFIFPDMEKNYCIVLPCFIYSRNG